VPRFHTVSHTFLTLVSKKLVYLIKVPRNKIAMSTVVYFRNVFRVTKIPPQSLVQSVWLKAINSLIGARPVRIGKEKWPFLTSMFVGPGVARVRVAPHFPQTVASLFDFDLPIFPTSPKKQKISFLSRFFLGTDKPLLSVHRSQTLPNNFKRLRLDEKVGKASPSFGQFCLSTTLHFCERDITPFQSECSFLV
jgi:hypothetical protein